MVAAGFAQASAGNEHLARSCDLHPNQEYACSWTVNGTYKIIWGRNSAGSAHPVWFVAEYLSGGTWYEDKTSKRKMEKGQSFGETSTYNFGSAHTWRLKLDAYGPFKNCTATGYIRNK